MVRYPTSLTLSKSLTTAQTLIYWPSRPQRATRLLRAILLVAALFYMSRGAFFSPSQFESHIIAIPIRPERFPVQKTLHLPRGLRAASSIPKIQHKPVVPEDSVRESVRQGRLEQVRNAFLHSWKGYKREAWGQDELQPLTGGFKSPFCGWAATLVDSLDTLIIMELWDEFHLAIDELQKIDFTGTEGCQINLFETTIRHLGGLLSAYDLSGGKYRILIDKAVELAEVLFTAFDTPNRMPSPHYRWSATDSEASDHSPSHSIVLAVLGTLSLEFTRLSQITGNDKYFDGIQRVVNELEKWQLKTSLPGMWPAVVDSSIVGQTVALGSPDSQSDLYTLGALADSAYEYLPKVSSS
jgi:mannosyl-oligosaccharide alpha-1,2-mannosidase